MEIEHSSFCLEKRWLSDSPAFWRTGIHASPDRCLCHSHLHFSLSPGLYSVEGRSTREVWSIEGNGLNVSWSPGLPLPCIPIRTDICASWSYSRIPGNPACSCHSLWCWSHARPCPFDSGFHFHTAAALLHGFTRHRTYSHPAVLNVPTLVMCQRTSSSFYTYDEFSHHPAFLGVDPCDCICLKSGFKGYTTTYHCKISNNS